MKWNRDTYELPLARGYVRDWRTADAARELIQNAVDAGDSSVRLVNQETDELSQLEVTTPGATLSRASLVLGNTTKADDADTVGSFGEGYKLALLVLAREERRVTVVNRDRLWTPRFAWSDQFESYVLVIDDRPASRSQRADGVRFVVHDLTPEDVDAVRGAYLGLQDDVGEVLATSYGSILPDRPGRLYVGGLLVCTTELAYGYDAEPRHLKLERDRNTVSGFDLKWFAKECWFATERWDEIAALMEQGAPDLELAGFGAPEMVKDACYRLLQQKHRGAIIARSQEELDQLVERGLTNVIVVSRPFYEATTSHPRYREGAGARATEPVPKAQLEQFRREYGAKMLPVAREALDALIARSGRWRLG